VRGAGDDRAVSGLGERALGTGDPSEAEGDRAAQRANAFARLARVVRGASPRPAGDKRFFYGDHIPWLTVGEVTKDKGIYFAYYYLSTLTERLRDELRQGGTQPNLNTGIVRRIVCPLLPKFEQLAILEFLESELSEVRTAISQ
jgi:hypothetical protein